MDNLWRTSAATVIIGYTDKFAQPLFGGSILSRSILFYPGKI